MEDRIAAISKYKIGTKYGVLYKFPDYEKGGYSWVLPRSFDGQLNLYPEQRFKTALQCYLFARAEFKNFMMASKGGNLRFLNM